MRICVKFTGKIFQLAHCLSLPFADNTLHLTANLVEHIAATLGVGRLHGFADRAVQFTGLRLLFTADNDVLGRVSLR